MIDKDGGAETKPRPTTRSFRIDRRRSSPFLTVPP